MGKHSSEDVGVGGAFGPDSIESGIREKVREVIQTIVNEELEAALGAGSRRGWKGDRATVTGRGRGR